MIKGVTHAHLGLIWHHSESSAVPYSPNQFLALDFFDASYSKIVLGFYVYDSTFYFSIAVVCIVGSGNDDEARIFGNKISIISMSISCH